MEARNRVSSLLVLSLCAILTIPTWASPYICVGETTNGPIASLLFKVSNPEGLSSQKTVLTRLTKANWQELNQVNRQVNAKIKPRPDDKNKDVWTIAPDFGDCDDFVVTKRAILLQRGWAPGSLVIAVVNVRRKESLERHVVLIIKTTQGDFALDNLSNDIKPWNETGHLFESVQTPESGFLWNRVCAES